MKKIKFRVWDKNRNKMLYFDNQGFCDEYNLLCFYLKTDNNNKIDGEYFSYGDLKLEDEEPDVPIMQYTGLKDKNGKEIYEGDIVKNDWTNYCEEYIGHNWVVKFGEYSNAEIDYGSSAIGFYCENKEKEQESPINIPTDTKTGDIEVIGNIYENPNLIK